ncbi:MAG: hypothetical protein FJ316_11865 [SAR202 cluster bacterium]|nr:hypothetical protein [SAR202 cluster bacterium]
MGIKWLYLLLAVLGGISPAVILYLLNLDRRVPGAFFDLGLFIFCLGIGAVFVPLGIVAGLAAVWLLQMACRCWMLARR